MLVKLLKATRMMVVLSIRLLALKIPPKQVTRLLQGSDTPDQNGASSFADFQLGKKCKGLRWIQKISKPCSQQQLQSELQSSTSYDLSQSDEMPLPVWRLGQGSSGVVCLATRKPDVLSEKPSVEQCMSSRPPNLSVPYEFMLQTYLSRPGNDNPYV
ncbi:hypothetical protein BASA61_003861 [Batrachochytrium salamandrivorans]|nr:hypothetical protein BASA61_003861 [Batrachochytrium salamandrivorans]